MECKYAFISFILLVLVSNSVLAEAYFDISDDNIKIETNFIGKEVIIFGILNDDQDTILTIKGPEKNSVIQKKERILGFWFNTKQITYNQIPSIFFIASSNNIEDILPASTIIKEELSFNYLLENKTSQRNFQSISTNITNSTSQTYRAGERIVPRERVSGRAHPTNSIATV